jgi:hypothetical protein
MADEKKMQEIQINFPPEKQGGVYANNMVVAHSKEEFILDFMMIAPPNGVVTSRVIMSPGHVKRVIAALQQNLKHYEEKFGRIEEAVEPPNPFGFQA